MSWRQWLRLILGWTLIVLGILGLFLPLLQGVLLIIAGAGVIGFRNPPIRGWRIRLRRRIRYWKKMPGWRGRFASWLEHSRREFRDNQKQKQVLDDEKIQGGKPSGE